MSLKRYEIQLEEEDIPVLDKFAKEDGRSARKQAQYIIEQYLKRRKLSKTKEPQKQSEIEQE